MRRLGATTAIAALGGMRMGLALTVTRGWRRWLDTSWKRFLRTMYASS